MENEIGSVFWKSVDCKRLSNRLSAEVKVDGVGAEEKVTMMNKALEGKLIEMSRTRGLED